MIRAGVIFWTTAFCFCVVQFPSSARQANEPRFTGRLLVVASDGDMQASAYQGDVLGVPTGDVLTVIPLDGSAAGWTAATLPVANSVIGPPSALAVTPDGRYAIVAETKGAAPAGAPSAKLSDLPPGRLITVVDLSEAHAPRIVQTFEGAPNPISVSASADGLHVVLAYDTAGTDADPLVVFRLEGGRLTTPEKPVVPGFRPDDAIKNATFDARSGLLGLVYAKTPRFSLLRLSLADGSVTLRTVGNDVPLGATPFMVRFTPDGRFALINDLAPPQGSPDPRGTITSIAVADPKNPAEADNRIVSVVRAGILPEGMTVSPNGRLLAISNLEHTSYPEGDPRYDPLASLTLIRLDPQTGELNPVANHPFAGALPEALAFDDTGRYLAVTSYDQLASARETGAIQIWQVAGDTQGRGTPDLAPTGLSIPLARGAHSMSIVR